MYRLLPLLLLLSIFTMNAQIHEIGIFVGGSNYVGDVGSTTYIAPKKPALGLLYKWNKSPRLSYRASITGAYFSAYDSESDDPSRKQRGYSFNNTIKEASLGIEFNFFEFNLHESKQQFTPYIHSGINYFRTNDIQLISPTEISGNGDDIGSLAIPMTLGIKSNIFPHFIIGLEVGARYTFTDNLDGSNPKDNNFIKFGNINNNDWYIFSGLTLSYTFGNKPCYCVQ
jgi:hypothetical protein